MKVILSSEVIDNKTTTRKFATFTVEGRIYGIDVMKVQEVTTSLKITSMHTAPVFVKGLINLRGQIATAIGLMELFDLGQNEITDKMTVVCRVEDVLLSLQVDQIGDVIEVDDTQFEHTPQTVPGNIRVFMQGVYKTQGAIISIINLDSVLSELDKRCA